ncbi:sugar phosphate isomerase/epimerase [Amycolatopsis rhabdoformis]|uniref:Sugar phosphate isomerase/epimerase n=1 Tax=Amycolatopsis rhabdoformis TaxID=1448059 RepID=A0ABZ1IGL8_9PSEU|nr:sugar phosphate isomerase/epimerase [Amycolatopsis rhabdoformis]WSE33605.1 sugar phosphate isomerase/epimerase [Amycolatopsis rhabdoformis]
MPHTDALLSTCWTSAGDVMPQRNGDRSPFDVRDRVAAAAEAGFTGFGITHTDLVAVRDGLGFPALAREFERHGITTVELEYLDDWWCSGARRERSDAVRADLLHAAGVLGASHLKAGAGQAGDTCEPDRLRAEFAALADAASAAGTRIALEPAAFSMMPTIAPAADLVRDLAHPAGGLLVDIWHIHRSATPYADLERLLPPDHVFAVELDDGHETVTGTLFEDTFDNRLYCGEGDFDVASFVKCLRRLGFTGPWGVEMMSRQHRTLDVRTATKQAAAAAAELLASTR